ncbi:hypothetical protein [Leptospira stimsonii]|uniref:Uncharacterized protein n=1 Tax=Leptospira stimsonii TaxID=2202203 RepID=A0A8B3CHJ6_9LEPT|nr:hypothetical protein [Leptospira stimsonii]RHX83284.1 hypothetical protein DLM78_22545 [Leptospira stimsonii]
METLIHNKSSLVLIFSLWIWGCNTHYTYYTGYHPYLSETICKVDLNLNGLSSNEIQKINLYLKIPPRIEWAKNMNSETYAEDENNIYYFLNQDCQSMESSNLRCQHEYEIGCDKQSLRIEIISIKNIKLINEQTLDFRKNKKAIIYLKGKGDIIEILYK